MSTKTDTFDSTMSAEAVLDGFESLVKEKGWKLKDRDGDAAVAKKGLNTRTFGDKIEISAAAVEGGRTRVNVTVSSVQVVDWGSNDDIAEAIRHRFADA